MRSSRLLASFPPSVRALAGRLPRRWRRSDGHDFDADLPAPLQIAAVDDAATRDVLLGFESLGATCEFGLVQRRYQAEPLGLFRWNLVGCRALVRALDQRLDGLGEPDNTVLDRSKFGEYLVRDRRFGFGMNTFKRPEEVDADTLHRQMCARIVFLRDKLLRDLADDEKIFVYRLTAIGIPEIEAIHDALSRFGRVRMLGVLASDAPHPSPSMIQPRETLCIGFLRPGQFPTHWDVPFEEWVTLCRMAVDRMGRATTRSRA